MNQYHKYVEPEEAVTIVHTVEDPMTYIFKTGKTMVKESSMVVTFGKEGNAVSEGTQRRLLGCNILYCNLMSNCYTSMSNKI